MARAKKKTGLLGGLLKTISRKPRKLTEEEIRDQELVEKFYEKGLDLGELEKYDRQAVGAGDVLREDDNVGDIKGPVYVINLKPFYECIGTREGRLAEGLVDLCSKVLRKKINQKGTYHQQTEDLFIFQFKDGVTTKNWRTALEIINEIGTTFLGKSYVPKVIVSEALGQGLKEDIFANDGGVGLASALKNITMDEQGKIKIAANSLAMSEEALRERRLQEEWERQHYDGLNLKGQAMRQVGPFRSRNKWVQRKGDRRKQQTAIKNQNRRQKRGRRVVDVKDAVVW